MSEPELSRLRQDLDVIEQAAGLNPPFCWRDVWLALCLVPCGLVILLCAAIAPWDYIFFSLVPLGLLAVVAAVFQANQYQHVGTHRQLRRESLTVCLFAIAFVVLIAWEKWLSLPAMAVRGAAFIIAGFLCIVVAATNRHQRVGLAAGVALVPFGIVLPLCSPQQVALVGGFAVAVAGIVAAILAEQLRTANRT